MPNNELSRAESFAQGVGNAYPPEIRFFVNYATLHCIGHSNKRFCQSRQALIEDLLNNNPRQKEFSQSIILEHLTHLALNRLIKQAGFNTQLTPQNLEASFPGHKGVDILITEGDLIYLGIDVKMRRGRSPYEHDGYGWNKKLLSPFIYLSLGNFAIESREFNEVNLRHWLKEYALVKINDSGKIPYWHDFELFLVKRIERSLSACLQRWIDSEEQRQKKIPLAHIDELFGFPQTKKELKLFLEKMGVMQNLFRDLILV